MGVMARDSNPDDSCTASRDCERPAEAPARSEGPHAPRARRVLWQNAVAFPYSGDPMASRPARPPFVVWLLVALVGLVGLAWAALAILLPPDRVRQIVSEQLSHSLARPVRFASASVSLWPPIRLRVAKLELAEPGGFARGTMFSTRAIDLDLDILPLLSHRVRVNDLAIESPVLHVLLRADGTTNLDGIAAPSTAGAKAPANAPMDLELREFRVRDGQLLIDDVRSDRRTAFALETKLSLATQQGGQRIATSGETHVRDLAFGPLSAARRSDLNQGLAKLDWAITHRGQFDAPTHRLALDELALALGSTKLALSGRVDDVGPHARLDLRA